MTRSADSLARDHTEAAIATLADAMDDPDTKYRIAAAKELLDRGHGKPLNATISVPTSRAQAQRLAQMSDEELQAELRATPLPQLAAPLLHPEEAEAIAAERATLEADDWEDVTHHPDWQRPARRALGDSPDTVPALDHDFDPLLD